MTEDDRARVGVFKQAAKKLGMKVKVTDERLAELLREIEHEKVIELPAWRFE